MPASKAAYWKAKFDRNRLRDAKNLRLLRELGWAVLVVWECEAAPRNMLRLKSRIPKFLGSPHH